MLKKAGNMAVKIVISLIAIYICLCAFRQSDSRDLTCNVKNQIILDPTLFQGLLRPAKQNDIPRPIVGFGDFDTV